MDKTKVEKMLKMWSEVMEDDEGFRVIDFVEVYGDNLEFILTTLVKDGKLELKG